jgi:NADH dehydrogenase [ubiquinone] 1 alpha subcomplex assembly factor 7
MPEQPQSRPPVSRDDLQDFIARQGGSVSIAEFMVWCLTGREDAYYRQGQPIGRAGDFITAPEVSQMFGELIGLWMGAVWLSMGRPKPFTVVELGPGRGTLMSDACRALRVVPGFAEAARLHLIEASGTLRAAQASALSAQGPQWSERLDDVPDGPLVLVANEFFDALPVEQYVYAAQDWRLRVVRLDSEGSAEFAPGERGEPPLPAALPPPEPGSIIETRPASLPFLQDLGRRAARHPVAALIVDYGYERDAYGDTLQAVRGHGYDEPLANPGQADLSAHVNFAELARMASANGLTAWGPLPQGEFLLALGLEARLQKLLSSARPEQRSGLMLGARRLTDPYQMGGLFKALALTGPGVPLPPPFTPATRRDA